ncbi:unnamed protein product [Victoria cruziana]
MSRCTYIPLSKSTEAAEELRMKEHRASFTIDCLERRLLAERMESRAALADVDRLQKRVMELERRLMEEVELVRKAERAFRSAIKKLESLDILSFQFGLPNTSKWFGNYLEQLFGGCPKVLISIQLGRSRSLEGLFAINLLKRRSCRKSTHDVRQIGQTRESNGREQTEHGAESKDHEQTQKACFTSRTGELSGYAKNHDICVP